MGTQKPNILVRAKKRKALEHLNAGRLDDAWTLYRSVCELDRLDVDAHLACAVTSGRRHDHVAAEAYCRRAIALDSQLPAAHFNLGIALRAQGKLAEAQRSFARATQLKPAYGEALEALAHAHIALYDWQSAARVLEESVTLWPSKAELRSDLGTVYQAMGRFTDAISAFKEALDLNPNLTLALNGLGGAFLGAGDLAQAEQCYRKCLALSEGDLRAWSNLLLLLNYLPDRNPADVLQEHVAWGRMAQSNVSMVPLGAHDDLRRLKVGYVSSDFREHSAASFFEPLVAHHDHQRFEIYCYSDLPRPDETTRRIMRNADQWRDIHALSDLDVARQVVDDGIDILIDLGGHTGNTRLRVFAYKPAPLQLTYLGYPNTTGLSTIDGRVTDLTADPMGADANYSEPLLRLPGCFLTYLADPGAPPVASSPALENGYVTFGSFNNFSKVNGDVLGLWAEVLRSVPSSRLLLKCPAMTDHAVRERVMDTLQRLGIHADRVDLLGHTATRGEHLETYAQVDIALDTFPYNGTTTTCEALWMGVPVVSLAGHVHAGRVGASLLAAVGRPEWVATTPASLIALAKHLASDIAMLAGTRRSLREQMTRSALCDAKRFAGSFEALLQEEWRKRVASGMPVELSVS